MKLRYAAVCLRCGRGYLAPPSNGICQYAQQGTVMPCLGDVEPLPMGTRGETEAK
jgi:hypothetical protein